MTSSVVLAALWAAALNAPQQVLLFSSDAIAVARDAATEWNRGPLPRNASFDIPDGPTKIQPGYFVVHFYVGTDIRLAVWINVTTGQVVELDRCVYFHSQKIRAFSTSIRGKTGARLIPIDRLADSIGCDRLKPA
jgi:hypothetical protein